jgi:hypothetical protein
MLIKTMEKKMRLKKETMITKLMCFDIENGNKTNISNLYKREVVGEKYIKPLASFNRFFEGNVKFETEFVEFPNKEYCKEIGETRKGENFDWTYIVDEDGDKINITCIDNITIEYEDDYVKSVEIKYTDLDTGYPAWYQLI